MVAEMSTSIPRADLEQRLRRFEIQDSVRACMNRYMVLCDALDAHTPLDELAGLFTEDAVWEGKVVERILHNLGSLMGRSFASVQELNRFRKEMMRSVEQAAGSEVKTAGV